jgi:hypothetical protein
MGPFEIRVRAVSRIDRKTWTAADKHGRLTNAPHRGAALTLCWSFRQMLAFALVFYEEFEDADNPDQPARARYFRVASWSSTARCCRPGPPRGCLVGAPGAAFAVIDDPENEAGELDALRGVRYPAKRQSI